MSRTPRVSVGLPVHDGEAFLGAAIESVLGQTFEDLELVITDNASEDATPEICRQYQSMDPRVRVRTKSGRIAADRRGASLASPCGARPERRELTR